MRREKTGRINRLLFGVYLIAVWTAFFFLHTNSRSIFFGMLVIAAAVLYFITPWLFGRIRRLCLPAPERDSLAAVCIAAFFATAAVLAIWRWATWPGGFSVDSAFQLSQAVSGHYNDWHPVWHTLLFFWLPVTLTGDPYSLFVFQDLVFSASMAYMVATVYTLGGKRSAQLAWAYIMLNPFVCFTAMFPFKDIPFALSAMTAATLAVQNWCARGVGEDKPLRWISLGIALANATLFRHNGILFSGILLTALLFSMRKKTWIKTAAVFAVTVILVRGPLYSALSVSSAENRTGETMGLPLSVIGNVVIECPEKLDAETAKFVYAIAPQEKWVSSFQRGNYNALKWDGANPNPIEDAGPMRILRMAWHSFRCAPRAATAGFIDLTDIVYGLDQPLDSTGLPYWNDGGDSRLVRTENPRLCEALELYMECLRASPFRYLFSIGASMLLVLSAALARCDLRKREDRERIGIVLSLFCYNFGTMLLLTGPDARLFLESFLVCPVFVLLMLYQREPSADSEGGEGNKGVCTL